ncbi:MAG: GNAT family N-acetyltransferase, partial [Proteobacteria bacterium]|nr:GNAT family N-acetyltransferase [Pseudomonadota bacterium]
MRPSGLVSKSAFVWWLFHYLRVFSSRDYSVAVIYCGDLLVHRSFIFPPSFRFPFMEGHDLQIGDTFTHPAHRGLGLAKLAISHLIADARFAGRPFWYIVEEQNRASIKVIESCGFDFVGMGL